jgi:DNA modification methylase
MIEGLTILAGDCRETLRTLPERSVHCVVTSPPYDGLRTYGGASEWDFEAVAGELFRVLVPGGVVCWNVADSVVDGSETLNSFRQALYFVDVVGFRMHDTMIYSKLNFSHPEKVRYHNVFEYVFVLSKGAPRAFNPIKDKRNATAGAVGNLGVNTFTLRDGSKSVRTKKLTREFGMRGNVWLGKTRGQEEMCRRLPHPAMMPKWLARDLILSWSNPGDLVLDPFGGSGTTAQQAIVTGRRAIMCELNPEYIELGRARCENIPPLKTSRKAAKAKRVIEQFEFFAK